MPYNLKNLNLDEISLVGSPANNRKFLIFKSMQKSEEGIKLMKTKPAGARAGSSLGQVTKADIEAMVSGAVQKAVKPLAEENAKLRKSLDRQIVTIRKRELEEIAKEHLGALGNTKETATILKSLEDSNMDSEAKTAILKTLKQANAARKEAMTMLGTQMGYNSFVQSPDSASGQINAMAKSLVAKSDKPMDLATARTLIRKQHPELAKLEANEYKEGLV
jgi:stage V sporulation protein SpoVS